MSEQTGQYNHDWNNEVYKSGLPQRCKEVIDELLLLNNKLNPVQVVTFLENKFKSNVTPKEHAQMCGCVNRTRSKLREQCEVNTVAGVKQFVANRERDDGLVDHDVCVVDSIVKSNELHVFFASKGMIGNLVDKECLACASDETFKMVFNNHTLRVMGVIDEKMKFTPTRHSLGSHVDKAASECLFDVTNIEAECFHGVVLEPLRALMVLLWLCLILYSPFGQAHFKAISTFT